MGVQNTYYLGIIKGRGRIYQQTFPGINNGPTAGWLPPSSKPRELHHRRRTCLTAHPYSYCSTQQARKEALQQSNSRGSHGGYSRGVGDFPGGHQKICYGREPLTLLLSAKERAKAEALSDVPIAAD